MKPHGRKWMVGLAGLASFACASARSEGGGELTPQAVVEELLAADRAFSAASARTDLISGLSAMFAEDVIVVVPGNRFADGRAAAIEALRSNADNARSRIEWTPVRAGISADGMHGFTYGFMTLHRPDGSTAPLKYLAYWIKGPQGWRVAGYKRRPAPAGAPVPAAMQPALPSRIVPVTSDPATIERHRSSLDRTERAFSDEAQKIGLAASFARFGSADAMNMGGPTDAGFVIGSEAIGKAVGAGTPDTASPVFWAPDHKVLVASSGDMGITFGMIRLNAGASETPRPPIPFFTIWRRESPDRPWLYIAE